MINLARGNYWVFSFFLFFPLISSILLIKKSLFSYSALYKSAAREKWSIRVRHPVKVQLKSTAASVCLLLLFSGTLLCTLCPGGGTSGKPVLL